MKYILAFSLFLTLFSCEENSNEDKIFYRNKFEEFSIKSDSSSKFYNSTYNLLVDSLTIRLTNYAKRTAGNDIPGIVKSTYFAMTTSIESSRIYHINLTLFKSNKLAFENYADGIVAFIDDTISINKLKNFRDIINVNHDNWKFIYLENMIIELYEPSNDVNLYLKKLLVDKDYKELELYKEGAIWTKK